MRSEGLGGKYLIQHSAGSGKTNSIAWTAHFLADLHDEKQERFLTPCWWFRIATCSTAIAGSAFSTSSVPIGVVATINGESASKSSELAKALSGGKKIVVCTIQTFPFALKAVQELAATQGKRFAVIADEAHSSQTGEAASKLKAVLSAEELKELEDGGEVGTEDILAAQMAARAERSRHYLRRFHGHAQGQNSRTIRPSPRSQATRQFRKYADGLPRLFHAPSH